MSVPAQNLSALVSQIAEPPTASGAPLLRYCNAAPPNLVVVEPISLNDRNISDFQNATSSLVGFHGVRSSAVKSHSYHPFVEIGGRANRTERDRERQSEDRKREIVRSSFTSRQRGG
jgi:hypothetical protein